MSDNIFTLTAVSECNLFPNAILESGFCAFELPVQVDRPRSVLSLGTADLLALEAGSQSVVRIFDSNGDGIPDTKQMVVSVPDLNHGLALSPNGDYLYASTLKRVYRWSYENKNLGAEEIIVDNINRDSAGEFPTGHATRTLAFDKSGRLYVSVGSNSNVDNDSYRARIRRFDFNSFNNAFPIDFSVGEVFADGLRNEVGLALDSHGVLWGVENGPDGLARDDLGGDIHQDNPAEELNRFREQDAGKHWGYPYCWTEYNLPSGVGLGRGTVWAWPDFLQNGQATDEKCRSDYIPPVVAMQGHSAPLGITFYQWKESWPSECIDENGVGGAFPQVMNGYAFVTFHGSWNRDIPTGYKVVYIPFNGDGAVLGDPLDLLAHEPPNAKWDNGFRPVDVDFDDCGRLLLTSDGTGSVGSRIVRIEYPSVLVTPSPTRDPSPKPSPVPTPLPSKRPTSNPSQKPTPFPSNRPTPNPAKPTPSPTEKPTKTPTTTPTPNPSQKPTEFPTKRPTPNPSAKPTPNLTARLTPNPSKKTTIVPIVSPTPNPTIKPTQSPTLKATSNPTAWHTLNPTSKLTPFPTAKPTQNPTGKSTSGPDQLSNLPSLSGIPSMYPSYSKTRIPLVKPSDHWLTSNPTANLATNPPSKLMSNPTVMSTSVPEPWLHSPASSHTPSMYLSFSPSQIPSMELSNQLSGEQFANSDRSFSPSTIPSIGPTSLPSSMLLTPTSTHRPTMGDNIFHHTSIPGTPNSDLAMPTDPPVLASIKDQGSPGTETNTPTAASATFVLPIPPAPTDETLATDSASFVLPTVPPMDSSNFPTQASASRVPGSDNHRLPSLAPIDFPSYAGSDLPSIPPIDFPSFVVSDMQPTMTGIETSKNSSSGTPRWFARRSLIGKIITAFAVALVLRT